MREVKLTEEEFHAAIAYVIALGKHSDESHNEAVLMSGSLGLSALICLLNNGDRGTTETDQNMLGPFWRMHSPVTPNGGSIVRSPTPGPVMFVDAWFRDTKGNPIVGAEVDIWHSSPEGFYENQDPVQADMNLRGKFFTDAQGHISFRSVKPAGYPIPIDGPTGDLLRAQGRRVRPSRRPRRHPRPSSARRDRSPRPSDRPSRSSRTSRRPPRSPCRRRRPSRPRSRRRSKGNRRCCYSPRRRRQRQSREAPTSPPFATC